MVSAARLIPLAMAVIALNAVLAALAPSWAFALVGLLAFMALLVVLYCTSPLFVVALSPVLFFWMTELFSGVFIEAGAYMVETRTLGEATGAFSRLALLYGLTLIFGWLTWVALGPRAENLLRECVNRPRHVRGEGIVLLGIAVILLAFFGFGLMNGFPLLQGVDRFAYRLNAGSQALISFLGNRYIMFALLGLIVAFGRRSAAASILFVTLMAISVLYGEKFTSLIVGTLFFAMPLLLRRLGQTGRLPWGKAALATAALMIVVLPAVLLNYGVLENPASAVQRLQQRAALQGQLWYLADHNFSQLVAFDAQSISVALRTLVVPADQSQLSLAAQHYGMYYVMRPFTDPATMYWTAQVGGGFVFAYAPYWLMTTGFIGVMIVYALTIIMTTFVLKILLNAIINFDQVLLIISTKIATWLLAGFTIGNLYFFFGVETMITLMVAILWGSFGRKIMLSYIFDGRLRKYPRVGF